MTNSIDSIKANISSCSNYLDNYRDFLNVLLLTMKNFGIMPNDVEILESYVRQRITDGENALADYNSELRFVESQEAENASTKLKLGSAMVAVELEKEETPVIDQEEFENLLANTQQAVEDVAPFAGDDDDLNNDLIGSISRHQSRKAGEPLQVGDIMYSSWGYEQTNIDFYQVVGFTKSMKSVKLRMIASRSVDAGFMSYDNMPDIGNFADEVITKRIKKYDDWCVSLSSYSSAWVWNGKANNSTHYA